MQKKLLLPILISLILPSFVACNSSTSDSTIEYVESSSVMISAFSLSSDSNVLDSLENVFFSIDLQNGEIFNADSLPYGTKVTKLVPKITAPTYASEVNLRYYDTEAQRDSLVNYLENSTDSIDFSQGPVTVTVKSQSGLVTKDYKIRVNVHQVKADSLAWYKMEQAPLPTTFTHIEAQCTAYLDGTFYCFTTDGQSYSLATTQNPLDPQWQMTEVALPFAPQIESLRASTQALYMLSTDNIMYASPDGVNWSSTGIMWTHIYGNYGENIIGAEPTAGTLQIASYPQRSQWPMPADFPVSATSQTISYDAPMAYSDQMVMVGGRLADGTLSADCWGFDGTTWMKISTKPLPEGKEYLTVVPYKLVQTLSTDWVPTDYPVLLAFGGLNAKGQLSRKVYCSRDWGMTWNLAPDLVQLPDALPASYGGVAFEYSTTMHAGSRSANYWQEVQLPALPSGAYFKQAASRSDVTLITEWECPAIYLFGGRDADNHTLNQMWRGVITQFTFRPVQ